MTRPVSAIATDLYQITMMAAYESAGMTGVSSFELFVRDLPAHRSYLVAAGLDQALDYLERLQFTPDEIAYLKTVPALQRVPSSFFDEVLAGFRFTGDVWAVPEGEVVFGHEPLLRVTAPAPQAQLVETALLAILTFQTSVASKAARVVESARGRPVVEFGSRRAHGVDAALHAARAAVIGGCASTSNVEAGQRFGLAISGTMAHSWVMAFEDEIEAFRRYIEVFGEETTLLIDTYDTVRAAQRIVAAGLRPSAVRLDSGDLAALAREVRRVFDAGGLARTKILVSGDLDEDRISALLDAGAPVDAFGVGTALSTSRDAPALGGVYKLVETSRAGLPRPTVKLSSGKRTFPGRKQVWRVLREGEARHDVLGLADEPHAPGRPLLHPVMREGRRVAPAPPVPAHQAQARRSLSELPFDVRRLDTPAAWPVMLSPALDELARQAVQVD